MLTDNDIINAVHKTVDYKLYDMIGLYLLVTKGGGKIWRFKYRFNKKEKTLVIGNIKTHSLEEARIEVNKAKIFITKGIDPMTMKKLNKTMTLNSPIKVLRTQLKHIEEMRDRLNDKRREVEHQLDSINYDLNEILVFFEETKTAIRFLEENQ